MKIYLSIFSACLMLSGIACAEDPVPSKQKKSWVQRRQEQAVSNQRDKFDIDLSKKKDSRQKEESRQKDTREHPRKSR